MRNAMVLTCAALCCAWAAAGCKSAEQKCQEARDAAAAQWAGYVTALERVHAQAKASQSEAQRKLSHDVEQRLSPAAQKIADTRYDKGNAAWIRAHTIAFNEACKQDLECSTLKQNNTDATGVVNDFDERLPLARTAHAALQGPIEAAMPAAKAVIIHPEYPQVKQAQQLTEIALELCKDLPATSE